MAGRRGKMDQADRAKQFLPFDALKGFREALREKERILVSKHELAEEDWEDLNRRLRQVKKRDVVKVKYFHEGEYHEITGSVLKIEETQEVICVEETCIRFGDIAQINNLC